MKLRTTTEFSEDVVLAIPAGPDKPGVVHQVPFKAYFKTPSNAPEARDGLKELMDEQGVYAFLSEILTRVEFREEDLAKFEFEDDAGNPVEPIEWVKCNAIAGNQTSAKFWKRVNKDVERKNYNRSRGR